MYKCQYFAIHELVPPQVFKDRGEAGWDLLDDRLLMTLDWLRERYGPMIVNNWHLGEEREWSGLRTPDSPYYRRDSQHTFGRAADCLLTRTTAEKVREDILANPNDPEFRLITSIEEDTSWLHFDTRNCERIKRFKP